MSVETELVSEPVETVEDMLAAVAELSAANDRRQSKLALAEQRLRVDREPRFAGGAEYVAGVQVLVQEHLFALGRSELVGRLERCVEEVALERSARARPRGGERRGPVRGLVGERGEGSVGGLPESGEQLDQHLQRCVLVELEQGRARLAKLEQERVLVGVVGK